MASTSSIFGYYNLPTPTIDDMREQEILEVRRFLPLQMEKEVVKMHEEEFSLSNYPPHDRETQAFRTINRSFNSIPGRT
ncbi:hypothetical protein TSAR_010303 [Trichomalopsis sarcophagae]|uniref:Uncharacterized protein n=1 Tax=Trichomalopsis sarcophagae TaxID=543379 RepID=A0A232EKI2_9HYME|nr:hypothetical protein TSAR_010303 [Trichomalopsis sarcophagae]